MSGPNETELNRAAIRALFGFGDSPERAIARLLRSNFSLCPEFRALLANALEAKPGPLPLIFRGQSAVKFAKATRNWQECFRRGRAVAHLVASGARFAKAVEAISKQEGRGVKSLEADVTYAGRADRWAQQNPGVGWAANQMVKDLINDHIFATALAILPRNVGEPALFAEADSLLVQLIEEFGPTD